MPDVALTVVMFDSDICTDVITLTSDDVTTLVSDEVMILVSVIIVTDVISEICTSVEHSVLAFPCWVFAMCSVDNVSLKVDLSFDMVLAAVDVIFVVVSTFCVVLPSFSELEKFVEKCKSPSSDVFIVESGVAVTTPVLLVISLVFRTGAEIICKILFIFLNSECNEGMTFSNTNFISKIFSCNSFIYRIIKTVIKIYKERYKTDVRIIFL